MLSKLIVSTIIIVIIIYSIFVSLWFYKLDKLNKTAIRYFIKNVSLHSCDKLSFKKYLQEIFHIFILPFRNQSYFEKYTEGGVYSSYFFEINKPLAIKMNDKIFWNILFKENNINHPKLIVYKRNHRIYKHNQIKNDLFYICKPIYGCLGANITKVQGKDVQRYLEKNNNILVQEHLFDCLYGKARHFRLVTLYDGTKFTLLSLKARNKTNITSNYAMGGSVSLCKNLKCDDLDDETHVKLNIFIDKLANLHKTYFGKVLHIGWDLMIDCIKENDVKIYCLEGNLASGIWDSETKNIDIISEYKNIANEFYTKNSIFL